MRALLYIRHKRIYRSILVLGLLCIFTLMANAKPKPKPLLSIGKDGKLVYLQDENGNQIPDFSYCGYESSDKTIPWVPAKIFIPTQEGDATKVLQNAIDFVAQFPMDENGFRGAIQLDKGTYRLNGRLTVRESGIVLRGAGMADGGTQLLANGTDRNTLITILGKNDIQKEQEAEVLATYIPVGAQYVTVSKASDFTVGQPIFIHRPSTQKWIDEIGMHEMGGEETGYIGWKPGQRDIVWDRTIHKIKGDTLFFDAPLTTALDKTYGVATVCTYHWNGRIQHIGIENLALETSFNSDNLKDEDHCYSAITIENAENVWVRQLTFTHFAGSAVAVYETARKVTVEDCLSFQPISEIGGWRRNTFFTMGQQTLFQRLYSEDGYHDFATGFCATGPNAFVECHASLPHSFSGAIDSWASGLLFDIVNLDGNMLSFANQYNNNQGAGWSAANSMFWQCSAARIENFAPPTAMNWCFASWAQFIGDGYWHEQNSHMSPRSLFYKQLADRQGKPESVFMNNYMPKPTEASSSPTVEVANELSKAAFEPLMSAKEWIKQASERNPIETKIDKETLDVSKIKLKKSLKSVAIDPSISIKNGWIVQGDLVLSGMRQTVPWWRGVARPYEAIKAQPAITRYVPGRYGAGYTDQLEDVVQWLDEKNLVAMEHNYGLWYDRRRDDHERIRRMNGNVWAPFYVQPFARSGQGTAWDGLSKYDLTKYDQFYWGRLKAFADLAEKDGRMLIHHNYFQHNILEAGAHWADSPWRPANNINNTGFPDPPPYAGDKRIFIAEQFYDIDNPIRRALHRKFIRQCLDNFADNQSVLQLISAEYTGPQHFVEFWLDVIKEWQDETGKDALIGLSTTKDVQDAILAQPERAAVVDVIDIRYWSYRPDGSCYEPAGGVNLAPRQHARLEKTGSRSFNAIYRNVIEYKQQFPAKAVIFSEGRFDQFGWAGVMAGASLPVLPSTVDKAFMQAASEMKPIPSNHAEQECRLANEEGECIIYTSGQQSITIDLKAFKGKFELRFIDVETGKLNQNTQKINGGEEANISLSNEKKQILWLVKK